MIQLLEKSLDFLFTVQIVRGKAHEGARLRRCCIVIDGHSLTIVPQESFHNDTAGLFPWDSREIGVLVAGIEELSSDRRIAK